MTKADELKVLEKIEKLISDCGNDSYIGMTFAGMVKVCKDNIANDFGNAPAVDIQEVRQKLEDARKECADMQEKLSKSESLCGAYKEELEEAYGIIDSAYPAIQCKAAMDKEALNALAEDETDYTIALAFRKAKSSEDLVGKMKYFLETSFVSY